MLVPRLILALDYRILHAIILIVDTTTRRCLGQIRQSFMQQPLALEINLTSVTIEPRVLVLYHLLAAPVRDVERLERPARNIHVYRRSLETPLRDFEGAVVRLAVAFHHDSSRQLLGRSAELTHSTVACKDVRFRLNYLLDLAI